MKNKLLIIGSGGLAKSILDSISKNNITQAVGFIDEYKNKGVKRRCKKKVLLKNKVIQHHCCWLH